MQTNPKNLKRSGFTLIELLVVIAIIGVLVGLTASAVMPLFGKGAEVTVTTELRQLGTAMETFKSKYGVYPPSRILLAPNLAAYAGPPGSIQQESLGFLLHIWPRLDLKTGVNWGTAQGLLQGDQCLVFFLGGLQTGAGQPGCLGFSTDPKNPMRAPGGELRAGPYFTFDNSRLIAPSARKAPYNSTAYVYLDPWGTMPYAYFSSLKKANGYNFTPLLTGSPTIGDCPDLMVSPYAKSKTAAGAVDFYNPDTFQIISAGKDHIFGLGMIRPPGAPVVNNTTPTIDQGADDWSNFAGGKLGAGL
jgi:general secretion pathway protein G